MILVTVGTHHQAFDRLIDAAEAYAASSDERVVVQRGPSSRSAPHCEVHDWLPPARLDALAREARAVVTHAGPGSVLSALGAGAPVIVVPRDPARGEHVDDHQLRFARHLEAPIVVLWDATRVAEALVSLTAPTTERSEARVHEETSRRFAQRLERVIDEIAQAQRPSWVRRAVARLVRGGGA